MGTGGSTPGKVTQDGETSITSLGSGSKMPVVGGKEEEAGNPISEDTHPDLKPEDRIIPTLIMLGTTGVGKSTIAKQVNVAYGITHTASDQDMEDSINAIIKSLVEMTMDISALLADGVLTFPNLTDHINIPDEVYDLVDILPGISDIQRGNVELKKTLQEIWKNKSLHQIGEGLDTAPKHWTYMNAKLCLKYIDYVFEPEFKLKHDDFVKVHKTTTFMHKTLCKNEETDFQLIDVGGQLHFQQEWEATITSFSGERVLIFVASLADYSENGPSGNRLAHSLNCWNRLLHNDVVSGIPIVLIINMKDEFFDRLETTPSTVCPALKDYGLAERKEDESDLAYKRRCLEAVKKLYQSHYMRLEFESTVDCFITSATDQFESAAVISHIVQKLCDNSIIRRTAEMEARRRTLLMLKEAEKSVSTKAEGKVDANGNENRPAEATKPKSDRVGTVSKTFI